MIINEEPIRVPMEDLPQIGPVPELVTAAPPIGEAELKAAQDTLRRYQEGKAMYDRRIIENEDWWKLQHWRNFRHDWGADEKIEDKRQGYNQKPTSAWLFNSISNKHADAMDNFPEPAVLARSKDDEETAKSLSSILPVIFDNCKFEGTYSAAWWDKLKNGCSVYGVFFNPKLYNGLGDIDIRQIDALNIYWEPGIQNIQDSKNIFFLTLKDNDILESQHPELKGKLRDSGLTAKKYRYDDHVDTSNKSIVVDWYYKVNAGGKDILHYVQWVDDTILFASENDPKYASGWYKHGKYPFVIDVLYEEKGTPAGFGFVDVMRSPQEYIDRISGDILDNAKWAAKPRYFSKDNSSVNEDEFLDTTRQIIHVAGSVDEANLRPVEVKELSGNILNVRQSLIDELKETSGNRDFSQGGTSAGITAASAISALIEAGNKGSRDMIKGAYRAYGEICELVIELVRQFYDMNRAFRITGDNGVPDYIEFNNAGMQPIESVEYGIDFSTKAPVYDINVKAQKSSPYSRMAQNELAIQFYQLGFFNPQATDQALCAIDMMDFEGKEKVREAIRKNGTLYEQLMQAQQTNLQMANLLANQTGDARILNALQEQMGMELTAPESESVSEPKKSMAEKTRDMAAESTAVR